MVKDGERLRAKAPGTANNGDELVPESESDTGFWLPKLGLWVGFVRDVAGKTTGRVGYHSGAHAYPLDSERHYM